MKVNGTRFMLPALTLTLLLAACDGGSPVDTSTPVTALTDSGAGSLRQAIADAKAGDTLKFTSRGTVSLDAPITTDKNLTIIATGVTIDAAGKGRVLEVPAGVTVTVQGGTLKGGVGQGEELQAASLNPQATSKATWGGNLINRGTLTLDGTSITGGNANNGGGIFNEKGATLTLKNVTMTGNAATIPTPDIVGESTGSGGAIANRGTLVIESGTFSGNTAVYTGGVVRHVLGTLTLNGGTFENNSCTNKACGGGVLMLGGTSVTTINGGTFTGNNADGAGEGGGGVILQSVTTSKLTVAGGLFKNNSSAYGGVIDVYRGGSLSITGGTFENNTASQYGGAVQLSSDTTAFEMSGGTIKGNQAAKNGGGINSDIGITLSGGTIEGNAAGESGGGFMVWTPQGKTSVTNVSGTAIIRGNTAKWGAGLNVRSADQGTATLNIKGGSITANTASDTGGGMETGPILLNISGGAIDNNTAFTWVGGFVTGGTVTMTGGSVSGNRGTGTGDGKGGAGGINLYSGAKMTASGGTISNNSGQWAGAVQIIPSWEGGAPAEFVLSGATLSGNKATMWTGGAFNNDGKLTIVSGSVTGNTATTNGGGVFNAKGAIYSQPGGTVSGNTPDNVFNQP